jgi:hypothetical protein
MFWSVVIHLRNDYTKREPVIHSKVFILNKLSEVAKKNRNHTKLVNIKTHK